MSDTYTDEYGKVKNHLPGEMVIRIKDYLMDVLNSINGGYFTCSGSTLYYPGNSEQVTIFSAIIPMQLADDNFLSTICGVLKDMSNNESIVCEVLPLTHCKL